ncbi:hypothetical protein HXZ66_14010 [Bacillus sp. A116_S68]|nr:hypothetical protein HXZ66_14010 [Bacillus sp. A116_S68]
MACNCNQNASHPHYLPQHQQMAGHSAHPMQQPQGMMPMQDQTMYGYPMPQQPHYPSAVAGQQGHGGYDQSGFYHVPTTMPMQQPMQMGQYPQQMNWQDMQAYGGYPSHPGQQQMMSQPQYMPQHGHGVMPATGYVPEEHDDDFE